MSVFWCANDISASGAEKSPTTLNGSIFWKGCKLRHNLEALRAAQPRPGLGAHVRTNRRTLDRSFPPGHTTGAGPNHSHARGAKRHLRGLPASSPCIPDYPELFPDFPQSQRLARARGPNHSHARGAKRYLRGHAQHPAHECRTSRTCFRTFPMSSGWRRRGGRITLMHRASGSTYRGVS